MDHKEIIETNLSAIARDYNVFLRSQSDSALRVLNATAVKAKIELLAVIADLLLERPEKAKKR